MKVSQAFRDMHRRTEERAKLLRTEVEDRLQPKLKERNWFFRSRVKTLESFALKIETGRFREPEKLED